jgi:hypothetical protein
MKFIRINKTNKGKLEQQYNLEPGYLELSSGMLLTADFGGERYHSILTPAAFAAMYKVVKKLDNGYYEIVPK